MAAQPPQMEAESGPAESASKSSTSASSPPSLGDSGMTWEKKGEREGTRGRKERRGGVKEDWNGGGRGGEESSPLAWRTCVQTSPGSTPNSITPLYTAASISGGRANILGGAPGRCGWLLGGGEEAGGGQSGSRLGRETSGH
eukprot:337338-Rhodomonas_salina.2